MGIFGRRRFHVFGTDTKNAEERLCSFRFRVFEFAAFFPAPLRDSLAAFILEETLDKKLFAIFYGTISPEFSFFDSKPGNRRRSETLQIVMNTSFAMRINVNCQR